MARVGQDHQKVLFVTIGATAAFDALIQAIFSRDTVAALVQTGYSRVVVQYGKDGKTLFDSLTKSHKSTIEHALDFDGFDFDQDGLSPYMVTARDAGGAVISHAGSGSILDALRVNAPLIVVPNSKLLDNHQDDLAEALSAQGYVVHGRLENLAPAIAAAEELRKKQRAWPPVNSGTHRRAQGLQGVIDEELGFLD